MKMLLRYVAHIIFHDAEAVFDETIQAKIRSMQGRQTLFHWCKGEVSRNASQHHLVKTSVDHIVLVIKIKIY